MLNLLDPRLVPKPLHSLSHQQKAFVNDCLSNDESSTDEELVEHFVAEHGLTYEQALVSVGFRGRFLVDPMFMLFPDALP